MGEQRAVDLLLAAGDTVEKVHQAAWFALLRDSEFLTELGVELGAPRKVEWEPKGGLFDLRVKGPEKSAWVELKIDSHLGKDQLDRQLAHRPQHAVVYALLGLSWIRARPWKVERAKARGAIVLGPGAVIAALGRVSGGSGPSPAVTELARSYAGQLDDLRRRGEDFRTTQSWWIAHSAYFFEQLRQSVPSMKGASIDYVPNPSRGFEACHWGWATAGEGVQCYLQWEDRKLCVKVLVEDRSKRRTVRDAAVTAVVGRKLGSWSITRPRPLGSGRTMTVGVLEGLPVQDGERWEELVALMGELTSLVAPLAKQLRGDSR